MLLIVGRKAMLQTATAEESGFGPYYGPSAPVRERPLGNGSQCLWGVPASVITTPRPECPAKNHRSILRRYGALRGVDIMHCARLSTRTRPS